MTEWISVKYKHPPLDASVLATDGKEQHVIFFLKDRESFCSGSGESCGYCDGQGTVSFEGDPFAHPFVKAYWSFTHWMPLPEVPNE